MDRSSAALRKRRTFVRLLVIASGLVLLALFAGDAHAPAADAQSVGWVDVTSDAVQTFYQDGVPPLPNGERFIPNGMYFVTGGPEDEAAVQTLHDAGFTVALGSGRWDPGIYVDAATDTNVRVILDQSQHANETLEPTFNEEWFSTYKDDPRVLGWLLYDEPLGTMKYVPDTPDLLPSIQAIYDAHKDQTDQLLFIDEQSLPDHPDWASALTMTDMAAHYAYLKNLLSPTSSLEPIASSVALQTALVGEAKPSWFIPQAYRGFPFAAFPTPQKARAQAYTAIIHGATGLIHFSWDSQFMRNGGVIGVRPDTPASYGSGTTATPAVVKESRDLWAGLDTRSGASSLNRQILALTDVLLSPTSAAPYTVEVDQRPISPAPIRTLLKEFGGERYLLAVNLDNATIDARFTFDQTYAMTTLFADGRGADWRVDDQLIDSFGPFETRAYRLTSCLDPDGSGAPDGADVTALAAAVGAEAGFSPDYRIDWDSSGNGVLDSADVQRFADVAAQPLPGCAPCPDIDGDGLTDCQEQTLGTDASLPTTLCLPYEQDLDGDGLFNAEEYGVGTDPCLPDTDGDLLGDQYEVDNQCLDPLAGDAAADPDIDLLETGEEAAFGTLPCISDTDEDGCADGEELGTEPAQGGRRDPQNRYDFFDVPLPPGSGRRDRIVSIGDIIGIVIKFGTQEAGSPNVHNQSYDQEFDRTRGQQVWQTGPPDGVISVVDIYLAIQQFGHSCYQG